MRDEDSAAIPVALLVLSGLAAGGMMLGSWRLVLYPAILLIGLLIAISLHRRVPGLAVSLPAAVVLVLLALYGALDVMGVSAPTGEGMFLGWDPMTALYLFGLGTSFLGVGLLYGLVFPRLSGEQPDVVGEEAVR